MTEGDSGGVSGEDPGEVAEWSAEEFAALAQQVALGAEHRFIASADPRAFRALAAFANAYPELADLVAAIGHAHSEFGSRIAMVRVSARWAELQEWCLAHQWRVLRIPGAVRGQANPDGLTGPVYWMQRMPAPSLLPADELPGR